MKYDVKAFELLSNEEIADGIFDMRVKNDELAPLAKCGQFAHVYVPSKTLRRPISVCDSENGVLRLVYQVKGEGTKIMSEMKKGEAVDILAPLGNGFNIEKGKRYCLIGGGIGVPPMLYTAKQTENPLVITGFRNKDLIILQDDFKNAGAYSLFDVEGNNVPTSWAQLLIFSSGYYIIQIIVDISSRKLFIRRYDIENDRWQEWGNIIMT